MDDPIADAGTIDRAAGGDSPLPKIASVTGNGMRKLKVRGQIDIEAGKDRCCRQTAKEGTLEKYLLRRHGGLGRSARRKGRADGVEVPGLHGSTYG